MKTWTEADNKLLARIRYARQNGVPLIESGAPGRSWWRAGGRETGPARKTKNCARSAPGVALQKSQGKRFLIYAVFSDATPSAMARVFQAYQCNYAMLIDMNALEHTYLARLSPVGQRNCRWITCLKGMSVLDKSAAGEVVPRFLGYPDNRDFFYVMRRSEKK